jgi:uncharacterized protein YeaO (DUF488 family)
MSWKTNSPIALSLADAATESADKHLFRPAVKQRHDRHMTGAVAIKRVYEPPSLGDGERILVDRVWPRGLSKAKAAIHHWLKDVAPSTALRRWFGHDPKRWDEFRRRYRAELAERSEALDELRGLARHGRVTLLFGARDIEHNQAVVLQELLSSGSKQASRHTR